MNKQDYYNACEKYYTRVKNDWGIYNNHSFSINGFRYDKNFKNHICKIIELANLLDNQVIVEAGCGFGENLNAINSKINANLHGITLCDFHIKNKRFPNIEYKNFDDLKNNDFLADRILFIESFSHSFNKAKLLKTAFNMLKNNGKIFILDLSVSNSFYRSLAVNTKARNDYKKHKKFYGDKPVSSEYVCYKAFIAGFKNIEYKENLDNYIINNNTVKNSIIIETIPTFYNHYILTR